MFYVRQRDRCLHVAYMYTLTASRVKHACKDDFVQTSLSFSIRCQEGCSSYAAFTIANHTYIRTQASQSDRRETTTLRGRARAFPKSARRTFVATSLSKGQGQHRTFSPHALSPFHQNHPFAPRATNIARSPHALVLHQQTVHLHISGSLRRSSTRKRNSSRHPRRVSSQDSSAESASNNSLRAKPASDRKHERRDWPWSRRRHLA